MKHLIILDEKTFNYCLLVDFKTKDGDKRIKFAVVGYPIRETIEEFYNYCLLTLELQLNDEVLSKAILREAFDQCGEKINNILKNDKERRENRGNAFYSKCNCRCHDDIFIPCIM